MTELRLKLRYIIEAEYYLNVEPPNLSNFSRVIFIMNEKFVPLIIMYLWQIKDMGMQSKEILKLVEECPKGSETLVTRIIHILTDRGNVIKKKT